MLLFYDPLFHKINEKLAKRKKNSKLIITFFQSKKEFGRFISESKRNVSAK